MTSKFPKKGEKKVSKIKCFLNVSSGVDVTIGDVKVSAGAPGKEIPLTYQIQDGIIDFEVPGCAGARARLGATGLRSVAIVKKGEATHVLGQYNEDSGLHLMCCAYNANCNLTVCGSVGACATCGDGSTNKCGTITC